MKQKNPSRLLKKLRAFANKNIREVLTEQPKAIMYPLPQKYLPSKTYLKDLYNQAYYCHYANMCDASLSLSVICLEKISRDIYKSFIGDPPTTWNQIIEQLLKLFKEKENYEPNKSFCIFFDDLKERKDRIRNLLHHGKIQDFIEDTRLEHKALNVINREYEFIHLKYDESIHGKKKGWIKHEKINILSHDTLALLSVAIIKFNKYLDLEKFED